MAHTVTTQSALDELISLGIAHPTWKLSPRGIVYSSYCKWELDDVDSDDSGDDDGNRTVFWTESIPGRHPEHPYSGFDPDWVDGRFHDHAIALYEINESDGIEVSQARAIFTNPYIAQGVDNATAAHLQTLGMELWVDLDNPRLKWHLPGRGDVAACVYKELNPMPYETFKKTFRYFLARHTILGTASQSTHLKPNVLPTTAIQPHDHFFDILVDSSHRSVRLGLDNETADRAWAGLSGKTYIDRATFDLLWALYRRGRSLWNRLRRFLKLRFVVYYWASLAARPDAAGNAPPGAIDAFRNEF